MDNTRDISSEATNVQITFSTDGVLDDKGKLEESPLESNITRKPIICPATACKIAMSTTSVLSHFLRHHEQNFPVDFINVGADQRALLVFDISLLVFQENVCLGVLAYEGKACKEKQRLSVVGPRRHNSFLPEKYQKYIHHLPIVILVSYTTLESFLPEALVNSMAVPPDANDEANRIIVIWLATVETPRPIYCTITAFDKKMITSRSSMLQVRSLHAPQIAREFLSEDCNFLMLNKGEIDLLSENKEQLIQLEIYIHED